MKILQLLYPSAIAISIIFDIAGKTHVANRMLLFAIIFLLLEYKLERVNQE